MAPSCPLPPPSVQETAAARHKMQSRKWWSYLTQHGAEYAGLANHKLCDLMQAQNITGSTHWKQVLPQENSHTGHSKMALQHSSIKSMSLLRHELFMQRFSV